MNMPDRQSWTALDTCDLATDQKAGGSSPSERARSETFPGRGPDLLANSSPSPGYSRLTRCTARGVPDGWRGGVLGRSQATAGGAGGASGLHRAAPDRDGPGGEIPLHAI